MQKFWQVMFEKVRTAELALGVMAGGLAWLSALPGVVIGQAAASVPTEVTDAITGAGSDGRTVAIAVLVALVTIIAVKYMRRGL